MESELREAPRETLGGVADLRTNARNVIFVVLALSHPQMVRSAPDGTVWNGLSVCSDISRLKRAIFQRLDPALKVHLCFETL